MIFERKIKMKLAKLIELREENRTHNLTELLLSGKSEISIGRRDHESDTQADIILGEDEKGEPNAPPSVLRGVSRRQALIGYDTKTDGYYIKDCSTHGTTKINDERLSKGEKRILERGVSLFFGTYNYGPVTFWQEL